MAPSHHIYPTLWSFGQETCLKKLFSLKHNLIYNTKLKAFFLRGHVEQNMKRESTETTFAIMFIQLSTLD